MKKNIVKVLLCALAIILELGFSAVFLIYALPVDDETYYLSLGSWEGEAVPDDWVYDQKGWKVFTQEGGTVTELTPDGYGGFTGLDFMGQTFYCSRVLNEEVDTPTLQLETPNSSVAVFLDGELLYTDCPELDNRIGYMCLPVKEWVRTDLLTVSLPENYKGKTLTIAQSSSPPGGEKQEPDATVWPCSVTLFCGYGYENSIISQIFMVAIPGTVAFIAGTVFLALFVMRVLRGKREWGLLYAALAVFFSLTSCITYLLYGISPVEPAFLFWDLALIALLAFLSSRMSNRRRGIFCWGLTLLSAAVEISDVAFQLIESLSFEFSQIKQFIDLATLIAVLLCGICEALQGNRFFRWPCLLAGAGAGLWLLTVLVSPSHRAEVWEQLVLHTYSYFLWRLMWLMMAVSLTVAVVESIRGEILRRAEARMLTERQKLSSESYEAMRQHNEQVMMLRHDMMKHYHLLRQMTDGGPAAAYLDELMEQNEKIRPVVQSGNEIIDIILNAKLSAAESARIKTDITRVSAPAVLPLSDAELCSVIMNLLDNALAAASAPGVDAPYIQLDLHSKGGFFVFSCKNAASQKWIEGTSKHHTGFGHGLGMKIVRQIVQRRDGLLEVETDKDSYKVLLAFPLAHASK